MKTTGMLPIFGLTLLALAASTLAQEPSPREQFKTAVAAYQKSASEDNALKLAELYKQLEPPPAIPPDAEYHAQKGAAFAELAKEPADFQRAVAEFEQAILLAPWVGEYHYNTALMLKSKAGTSDLEAAMRSIKLARLFAKDDKEKRDAAALSAKLEVALEVTRENVTKEANLAAAKKAEEVAKQEKENLASARAAREKEAEQRFNASLEGAKYVGNEWGDQFMRQRYQIEITHGEMHGVYVTTWVNPKSHPNNVYVGFRGLWPGFHENVKVQGRVTQWHVKAFGIDGDIRVEIYEDHLVANVPGEETITLRRQ